MLWAFLWGQGQMTLWLLYNELFHFELGHKYSTKKSWRIQDILIARKTKIKSFQNDYDIKYMHNLRISFSFLCHLQSIVAHRDQFVCVYVCLSGSHTSICFAGNTRTFLGMLPFWSRNV